MWEIKDRFSYMPSGDVISKGLSTRKGTLKIGGATEVPGFFSTDDSKNDGLMVAISVFIEVVGVILTIYAASKLPLLFVVGAALIALFLFIVDVFLAIQLHKNEGDKCILKTELFLTESENSGRINQLEQKLKQKENKIVNFFIMVGFIFLVLLKIAALVVLGAFGTLMVAYVLVFLFYLINVYIHYYYTGFWWNNNITFKRALNSDYNKNFTGTNTSIRQQPIECKHRFVSLPMKSGQHSIDFEKDENGNYKKDENGNYNYTLNFCGLILDEDISNLYINQDAAGQILIAKECRKLQLTQKTGRTTSTQQQSQQDNEK